MDFIAANTLKSLLKFQKNRKSKRLGAGGEPPQGAAVLLTELDLKI